jgi:drug/metabolite transporter (DMT)-like permease
VTPVLALSLGALVGGEALTLTTVAGTVLVLVGVGLTLRSRRAARNQPARALS